VDLELVEQSSDCLEFGDATLQNWFIEIFCVEVNGVDKSWDGHFGSIEIFDGFFIDKIG
jgi:hypothetical protein